MEQEEYLKDGKIDISEEGITYWADQLKCNEKDLKDAICRLGTAYNVLVLYLQMNQLLGERD